MNKEKLIIKKTNDFNLIKSILCDDEISSNLLSFKYENMEEKLNNELMIYYIFLVDGKIAGFCAFKHLKDICNIDGNYAVDIGIFKRYRGKIGYRFGEMMLFEFNKTFSPNKIFALIQDNNKASILYTRSMGFKPLVKENGYCILGT